MIAQPPVFCGRCGSPLAPGSRFCGTCGAVQSGPAPAYAYTPTSPAAPAAGRGRLGHRGVLAAGGGALLVLVAVGVLILRITGTTPAKCKFDCDLPKGTPLSAQHSYTSSSFGFQVDYPDSLGVGDQAADHLTLMDGRVATVSVSGKQASAGDDALVQQAIRDLPSSQYQDVRATQPIYGAHIGSAAGSGQVYDANFFRQGGQAEHVRVVVIAASRSGTAVVIVATTGFDGSRQSRRGVSDGELLDDLLSQFRWSGE